MIILMVHEKVVLLFKIQLLIISFLFRHMNIMTDLMIYVETNVNTFECH
jgi:hypothetical protein